MGVGDDYGRWVKDAMDGMVHLLRPEGGRVVLLSNRFNERIWTSAMRDLLVHVENQIPLLVNGHPASAIVARRRG